MPHQQIASATSRPAAINDLSLSERVSEPVTKADLLTRAQVAKRLGISLSSVRRMEDDRLHPTVGADGVRRFDPAEVAMVASELIERTPAAGKRRGGTSNSGPPAIAPGELAARVFECLEERQSLAEIVVGLRVAPDVVRKLHHEWLVGLVEGELANAHHALPMDDARRLRERHMPAGGLAELLASLPVGTRTRISVARDLGDFYAETGEARSVVELGGIVVTGPIDPTVLSRRYGKGAVRITAYCLEPRGCLWEVLSELPA
jgi:hypothetical protein